MGRYFIKDFFFFSKAEKKKMFLSFPPLKAVEPVRIVFVPKEELSLQKIKNVVDCERGVRIQLLKA
jgi:hypothetical protein